MEINRKLATVRVNTVRVPVRVVGCYRDPNRENLVEAERVRIQSEIRMLNKHSLGIYTQAGKADRILREI